MVTEIQGKPILARAARAISSEAGSTWRGFELSGVDCILRNKAVPLSVHTK